MIGKNLTISGSRMSLYCASDTYTSGIYERPQQIRAQAGWVSTITPSLNQQARLGVKSPFDLSCRKWAGLRHFPF